jgi:RNA polymerase sigma-70 factor (ECF subfamily)
MEDLKKKANIVGERLRSGHDSALEELIDLYKKKIYNISYRYTGDAEEAFDLSQEIFLRAYSKIKLFKSGTDFHSWFMRLAVNMAINYKKRIKKNPSREAFELSMPQKDSEMSNTPAELQEREKHKKILLLLKKLPKRERAVLILQLWEERKVSEIAEIMGTTIKSVESLLTRARKRLRMQMEKSEGF